MKKCNRGHVNMVPPGAVYLSESGKQIFAHCQEPDCKRSVSLNWNDARNIFGLPEDATKSEVVAKMRELNPDIPPVDPEVDIPGDDTTMPNDERDPEEIIDQVPQETVLQPAPKGESKRVGKEVPRRPPAESVPAEDQQSGMRNSQDDLDTELSARDILLKVIEDSDLTAQDKYDLISLIKLEPDWDFIKAKGLFERFGMSSAKVTNLSLRFRNKIEIYNGRRNRQDQLMGYMGLIASKGSEQRGNSYMGNGVTPGYQDQQVPQDPCSLAIRSVIQANGGIITPQIQSAIDAIRAAYGQYGQSSTTGGIPGMSMNPMTIQQMLQQNNDQMFDKMAKLIEASKTREKDEQAEKLRKEEQDKKFADLQQLVMLAVAGKNNQPLPPTESETDRFVKIVGAMKTLTPEAPASAEPSKQDMMMDKMFDLFMENLKAKPEAASVPIVQAIAKLEDQMSRMGGGINGLPTNPEQLRGLVDYTRAAGDIEKIRRDYEDKAATRDLISNVIDTGIKSIGEAAAAVFMQNPGTPQETSHLISEQTVDTGVVRMTCPSCGTPMTAPAGAMHIICPICGSKFDRQMNIVEQPPAPEEVTQEVTQEVPPMETQEVTQEVQEIVPETPAKAPDPKREEKRDVGPLSKVVMERQEQQKTGQPASETNITPPEEQSSEEIE